MTIEQLFEKLDYEYDRQGEHAFDPVTIAQQAIREVIERAKPWLITDPISPRVQGFSEGVEEFEKKLLKEFGFDNNQGGI